MIQLTDLLYQATDKNLITTLMTIDESAAFDTVQHSLLLEKMKLYKFSTETINWFSSYLSFRSMYVSINNKSSRIVPVHQGVPQGSVLGPLLYTIFINELPELSKDADNCLNIEHQAGTKLFPPNCSTCGAIPCYADDATVVHSSNSRQLNNTKLEENLNKINNFLSNNKLAMNASKTTINEVMVQQKRTKTRGDPPSLLTTDQEGRLKTIHSENYTRLLGANVGRDLGWKYHLETGDKATLPRIRQQLGALTMIRAQLPFRSRLNLVNGLLISKICYLIQIWGGAHQNYVRKVQVVLNKAARFVTKLDKRTSTKILMERCNWLTIKELIGYHSLVSMWSIVNRKIPEQVYDIIIINEDRTISTTKARLLIVSKGFRWRTVPKWNCLPDVTRHNSAIGSFKKQVKTWIKQQRQINPG